MMQSVRGIYRDGKVELLEPPAGVVIADVIVTFVDSLVGEASALDQNSPSIDDEFENAPQRMYFGMFAGDGEGATEEDFRSAEFHGDDDDGLDWS